MSSKPLQSWLDQLRSDPNTTGSATWVGLPTSAIAHVLSRLARSSVAKNIVIFSNNDENSEELFKISQALIKKSYWLPTWSHSVYSTTSPSIRIRHQRVSTLFAAAHLETEPDNVAAEANVFFATLASFSQATTPPGLFKSNIQRVALGMKVGPPHKLADALIRQGYLRADLVEDPGTLSVRGEILDVFPPNRAKPFRIEFFDDEVEKIRSFDPTSQRSSKETFDRVHLTPAREVTIESQETLERLRMNLKLFCDERGIQRSDRETLLSGLEAGFYPSHFDAWAPFMHSLQSNFSDFFDEPCAVVFCDKTTCVGDFDRFLATQREKSQQKDLPIIPDPMVLFNENIKSYATKKPILLFEPFEQLGQNAHRPNITTFSQNDRVLEKIPSWLSGGLQIEIFCSTPSQQERTKQFLEHHNISWSRLHFREGSIRVGFLWEQEGLAIFPATAITGFKSIRQKTTRPTAQSSSVEWRGLSTLSDLAVGDAVVHIEHGIGQYVGLKRIAHGSFEAEFLVIQYANDDKLLLPVDRLNKIQRYAGFSGAAKLDRLGNGQFEKSKQRVRDAVKKLAFDLIELYAKRKIKTVAPFRTDDPLYEQFEERFPYDETPDQQKAIEAVLSDLSSGTIMDRLVCGDVGFGKTEVAIRATFIAALNGKQTCVLVPTTLLAQQHEETFRKRLDGFPITIESISRFKSPTEQKEILSRVKSGHVDVLIGTHRALSKDVHFKELGLLVIDEEHRFGVEHKEIIKNISTDAHVLTLTATPIPRTLHFALSGLREISTIQTPPMDRLPVKTAVAPFDLKIIQEAIEGELVRGGQVFVVHNRVQSISRIAAEIQDAVPSAKVAIGHGQMSEAELEKVMLDFYHKKTNVLVSTTIIESGLDVSSANTLVVTRADQMGLAQLYQLRGRVGRSDMRAFAYFLISESGNVSDEAKQRLDVIQRFVDLGSGFSIASHDLELRGGGNLLGPEQSGHIADVGFDLYTELLQEAIEAQQGSLPEKTQTTDPEIKVPYSSFLDEEYVPGMSQRLALYRRLSRAKSEDDLQQVEEEMVDRYGPLHPAATNLLWLLRIKLVLQDLGASSLALGQKKLSLFFGTTATFDVQLLLPLLQKNAETYSIQPNSKLIISLKEESLLSIYHEVSKLREKLAITK